MANQQHVAPPVYAPPVEHFGIPNANQPPPGHGQNAPGPFHPQQSGFNGAHPQGAMLTVDPSKLNQMGQPGMNMQPIQPHAMQPGAPMNMPGVEPMMPQGHGSRIPGADVIQQHAQMQGPMPLGQAGPALGFPQQVGHPLQAGAFGGRNPAQQLEAMGPFGVAMQNMQGMNPRPQMPLGLNPAQLPPVAPAGMRPVPLPHMQRGPAEFAGMQPNGNIPAQMRMIQPQPGHMGHEALGLNPGPFANQVQFPPTLRLPPQPGPMGHGAFELAPGPFAKTRQFPYSPGLEQFAAPIPEDPLLPFQPRGFAPQLPPSIAHPINQGFLEDKMGERSLALRDPRMHSHHPPSRQMVIIDRPYGYPEYAKPYPDMELDTRGLVEAYITAMNRPMSQSDQRRVIDILAQRSPSEIAMLRIDFRRKTGTPMDIGFLYHLDEEEMRWAKVPYLGLMLGITNLDLYLIENASVFEIPEAFIDIFVGRDPRDIQLLDMSHRRVHGEGLVSILDDVEVSDPIRIALKIIVTEASYHQHQHPGVVDFALVDRDVDELIEIRQGGIADDSALLSTILRRSPSHLHRVAVRYKVKCGVDMDRDFRRGQAYQFHEDTRRVVVHAIRSAVDPTYRDCMLLKDALGRRDPTLLAVRMTRMHWYSQHWHQVKAAFIGHSGYQLIDQVNSGKHGELFRDLMVSMAQVPVAGSFMPSGFMPSGFVPGGF